MNNITIDGRLAADPELKYVSGKPVASLRFGHTPRDKRGGEWVDGETVWLSAEVWGQHGEVVAEFISKGDLVLVTGELRQRTYEVNGSTRIATEIKRATVALVKRKGAGATSSPGTSSDTWPTVPPVTEEPAW